MKLYAILTVALIAAGGGVIVLASLFYYPFQPNPMQYNIASESRDKNPMPVAFENATNLTNNPMDSVYGQVAAWNNNVYLLWEDSMPLGYRNYDIFIKTSTDNGTTFGAPINLSNNSGFSEHPQIAAYGNNVYAIWADDTSGNKEVLFTRSEDNSTNFEKIKNLSNTTSELAFNKIFVL